MIFFLAGKNRTAHPNVFFWVFFSFHFIRHHIIIWRSVALDQNSMVVLDQIHPPSVFFCFLLLPLPPSFSTRSLPVPYPFPTVTTDYLSLSRNSSVNGSSVLIFDAFCFARFESTARFFFSCFADITTHSLDSLSPNKKIVLFLTFFSHTLFSSPSLIFVVDCSGLAVIPIRIRILHEPHSTLHYTIIPSNISTQS